MTMHIREQDDYDRTPDPDTMTYTEAQICNNITNCGNEIDMVDGTIRLLVQQMLLHWGFACDQTKICVVICVHDIEEAVTWIDYDRKKIDFRNVGQHILGMNAAIKTYDDAPHAINFGRGGSMGNRFDLHLREKHYDE